jgi:hypothetical protein
MIKKSRSKATKDLTEEVAILEAKLMIAKYALEFYADKESYGCEDTSCTTGNQVFDVICFDFDRGAYKDYVGKRAREALKAIK